MVEGKYKKLIFPKTNFAKKYPSAGHSLFYPHLFQRKRTHFLDANEVVKLEFGEFLLHPGHLVHGGVRITRGTRYLMVIFARK